MSYQSNQYCKLNPDPSTLIELATSQLVAQLAQVGDPIPWHAYLIGHNGKPLIEAGILLANVQGLGWI